ncbi:MAG: helix-turn-helix transcriptional regulator [Flaviaesturariibacter sp.]|nr:helix-turn-helix transcriptional regulator [Flaviaesturariibacter sp.]
MRYRFTTPEKKQIELLAHHIEHHLHTSFTMTDLCRRSGMNAHKLNEGCIHFLDQRPMRFIAACRMSMALFLLRHTDQPIKEISFAVGFRYTKNFMLAFKLYWGRTAGQVRKSSFEF